LIYGNTRRRPVSKIGVDVIQVLDSAPRKNASYRLGAQRKKRSTTRYLDWRWVGVGVWGGGKGLEASREGRSIYSGHAKSAASGGIVSRPQYWGAKGWAGNRKDIRISIEADSKPERTRLISSVGRIQLEERRRFVCSTCEWVNLHFLPH